MPNPVTNRTALNIRYCELFGVDPAVYAGFRLTVLTEHLPVLERFNMTEIMPDGGWRVERQVVVPTPAPDGTVEPRIINVDLCRAFGVDTATHAGFRFTVLGGELPALEAFVLPPVVGDGHLSDAIAEEIGSMVQSGRFTLEAPDSVRALDAVEAIDVVPETTSEPAPERHVTPVFHPIAGRDEALKAAGAAE